MKMGIKNLISKFTEHAFLKHNLNDTRQIINNTLNKIINYYNSLDYSKLTREEFRFFQNTVLYHNFIHDLCYYTVTNTDFSHIAVFEEKKEFYLDLKEKKETLEEQICELVNKWIILRISYKIDGDPNSLKELEESVYFKKYGSINFNDLVKIRRTLKLLYKIGALKKYSLPDEFEEYKELYKKCNHNVINTVILTKNREENLLLEYSKNISNEILHQKNK